MIREDDVTVLERLRESLSEVSYRDWKFEVLPGEEGGFFLRVRFDAPDRETGEDVSWTGRKWTLSRHMTRSEVVQTALKAVLTAIEHEAREEFMYKGVAIFGPHLDVEQLWSFQKLALLVEDVRVKA